MRRAARDGVGKGPVRRLLEPVRPDPLALALLAVAAAAVLIAGLQHARLVHRGFGDVEVVGLLFALNALGSAVVVLTLIAERVWAFVLGTLSICVPSLVSIAISHSSIGFLGFREGGYDADALVIVGAEVVAVVFALAGGAVAARSPARMRAGAGVVRAPLALVVVAALACAAIGIGMGSAPAAGEPAPSAAAVAAARQRVAAGGASVRRGRELFTGEGCDRCHAIAAIDAGGMLGPRLDTIDEQLDDNLESIREPREDITDGFPPKLMPTDFEERLGAVRLRALAAFVTAVSGGEQEGGEGGGGGRGRNRGRGGSGED
jgi:cytochrome c551/c552